MNFFIYLFYFIFFTFNKIRSVHCKDRLHRVETPTKFRNKVRSAGRWWKGRGDRNRVTRESLLPSFP